MLNHRIVLSIAACLVASAVLAEEPECGANYKSDATSSQTSVLTSLSPKDVIEVLPYKLAKAGVTMEWSNPDKGILKAGSLDVKAELSGTVTRVILHSSPAADQATLCRYATLVGNPPPPPAPPQDPALIAQLKNDLRIQHEIVQPGTSGLNKAIFKSLDDFLHFAITGIKDLPNGKREYKVSIQMPPYSCGIASEDLDISTMAMLGQRDARRTKPVRVEATLIYAKEGTGWNLTDAFITHIESMK
jgi:hypothetical protein